MTTPELFDRTGRTKHCATCEHGDFKKGDIEGICRRRPPVILETEQDSIGHWPIVKDVDWCGEYRTGGNYVRLQKGHQL